MPPGAFYLGVYLKDILAIYMGVYRLFLLIIGDETTVYKCQEIIIAGFSNVVRLYISRGYINGKEA